LRKQRDLDVQVVNGAHGELTVSVDGRTVARKEGDKMPSAQDVLSAVHNHAPAH
jgi:hypothetical protein